MLVKRSLSTTPLQWLHMSLAGPRSQIEMGRRPFLLATISMRPLELSAALSLAGHKGHRSRIQAVPVNEGSGMRKGGARGQWGAIHLLPVGCGPSPNTWPR